MITKFTISNPQTDSTTDTSQVSEVIVDRTPEQIQE